MTAPISRKRGMAVETTVAVNGQKWAGEMVLCLRAHTVLAEAPSLMPSTHASGSQPIANPALCYSGLL